MPCAAEAARTIGSISPTASWSRTTTSIWPAAFARFGRAHRNRKGEQPIQVEVRSMAELEDALKYGAEAILLDNMTPEQVCLAVQRVAHRHAPRAVGGLRRDHPGECPRLRRGGRGLYFGGALTHSARAVDLSMRIEPA